MVPARISVSPVTVGRLKRPDVSVSSLKYRVSSSSSEMSSRSSVVSPTSKADGCSKDSSVVSEDR